MKNIKIKFIISIVIFLIMLILFLFLDKNTLILKKYVFPIIFIAFIIDNLIILLPNTIKYIPSVKHLNKFYIKHPNYNKELLLSTQKSNNWRALFTFIVYFGVLSIIGLLYLSYNFLEDVHLYLLFLLINIADYFCILIWCPYKSIIFKNTCCNTCRITNWDRLMKSYILIFVPNVFTITLVVLGILVFLIWEYTHQVHPERFYLISNEALWCNNCAYESLCNKKRVAN